MVALDVISPKLRHRVKMNGHVTTYVACPKQKFLGQNRTNHVYDCAKCPSFVGEESFGVLCSWSKYSKEEI